MRTSYQIMGAVLRGRSAISKIAARGSSSQVHTLDVDAIYKCDVAPLQLFSTFMLEKAERPHHLCPDHDLVENSTTSPEYPKKSHRRHALRRGEYQPKQ